ncbi:hypothetical protein ACFOWB_26270 [Chenggangzhangella methanolivorans]|uniref:hypothetical protein n=1 Tax=Chenggangzhangella methanolivorans TaxID=1437009 RepID=UPI00360EB7FE
MSEQRSQTRWKPLAFMLAFVAALAVAASALLLNKDEVTEPLPKGGPTVNPG